MKDRMSSNDISFLMDQIRDIPFLTKAEEIEFSKKVQEGAEAKKILDSNIKLEFPPELIKELEKTISIGMEAKNRFVTANMLLVISLAKRYSYKDIDLMELIQEGSFGLIRAAEKFDPSKGFKFVTYATYWINKYIGKYINKTSGLVYIPNHAVEKLNKYCKLYNTMNMDEVVEFDSEFSDAGVIEMGAKDFKSSEELYKVTQKMFSLHETIRGSEFVFEDIILEEESENLEDSIILKIDMNNAIDTILDMDEKAVIYHRFGIADTEIGTIAEIADSLGKTKDKIRKIEKTALKKLKDYLTKYNYQV